MGQSGITPIRHLFPVEGSLFYASAAQNDGLFSDTTMHCAMVYAVTQNLLNGYRHYGSAMPTWLPLGISHHLARNIDMKRNYFTDKRLYDATDKNIWKWNVKAYKRVNHKIATSYDEMTQWNDSTDLKYNDHVMAWARADYLLQTHPDWVAQWLDRVQDSYTGGLAPTAENMVERDKAITSDVFIFEKGDFDSNWNKWVKSNYPKK